MTSLWITIFILTLSITAVLVYILFQNPIKLSAQRTDFDLAVYRDQLKELEHERERGLLSEEETESAITEIKRRMLKVDAEGQKTAPSDASPNKRGLIIAALIAVTVPAFSVALYMHLGNPQYPDQPFAERDIEAETAAASSTPEQAQISDMVQSLADKLAKNPDDIKGWLMLGRSYLVLKQQDKALKAYKRAMEISGNAPEVSVDYAEALTSASQGAIPQEAITIFSRVQAELPLHPKPWFYLGMAKAQNGDIKGALQDWVDLIAISPADASYLSTIEEQIGQAVTQLGIDRNSIKPSARAQEIASQVQSLQGGQPAVAPDKGPTSEQVDAAQDMNAEERQSMINSMVERLAERLKQNPNDKQGWIMLGRSYEQLGRTEEAKEAFAKAEAL